VKSVAHRLPRLFLDRDLEGESVELDEHEAHYLGHVLRLGPGDSLVAFNGRGAERFAAVSSLRRRGGVLAVHGTRAPLPESPLDLVLLQALPKSDAMDLIVQKATELGVRSIRPVFTEFSVVRLDPERSERRLEHWRKIARSACEQCGRHTPPLVAAPVALAEVIAALPAAATRLALDHAAERRLAEHSPAGGLVIAVGPEGGFGPADWRRLDAAAFARVRLGGRVLRAETATLAAAAIAQSRWGDL
jgi:16S rRNA (uracil1498-N3)-methyltransferase